MSEPLYAFVRDLWPKAKRTENNPSVCSHSAQSWSHGPDGMYCDDCQSIIVQGDDGFWRKSPSRQAEEA